jgi:enoyl-CoA hydratase/carnithine racemase
MSNSVQTVDFVRSGATAWLRLDRPPHNLLVGSMTDELRTAMIAADEDDEVKAIVIGGRGRIFCGGADVAALRVGGDPEAFARSVAGLFRQFAASTKPIIAAVNGDALASGFGLVCLADLVVATPAASLGTNEARFGSWPMLAQVALLHRIPLKPALRTALTGEPFTSAEAQALGIVDQIVEPAALEEAAERLAEISARGGAAARVGRPLLYRLSELPFDQALDEAAAAFSAMFAEDGS